MAAAILNASEEKYRYMNVAICQLGAPRALRFTLKCGASDKRDNETYHAFLCRKGHSNQAVKKFFKFKKDYEKVEKNKDSASFDVSLLVTLIQNCCSGLALRNDDIWTDSTNTKRVESLIYQIKERRNAVAHNSDGPAIAPNTFTEMKERLEKLIDVSGTLYGQPQADIAAERLKLAKLVASIKRGDHKTDVDVLKITFQHFSRSENIKYWTDYGNKTLIPFSGKVVVGDVFQSLDMIVKAQIGSASNTRQSYANALDECLRLDNTPITVVVGEAGSGKTTAMKTIARQFLGLIPQSMQILQENEFDSLHFLECRDSSSCDFDAFVANNFPEACREIGRENIKSVFLAMNTFTLVDGYDECNPNSQTVLNEMLQLLKKATSFCRCIITTRPHALPQLKRLINSYAVNYVQCTIVDITDLKDQTEFLLRYETSNIPTPGLTATFKTLAVEVLRYFTSPIRLVWFFFLHSIYKDQVMSWKNEYDVLIYTWQYYVDTLLNKMQDTAIINTEQLVEEILFTISNYLVLVFAVLEPKASTYLFMMSVCELTARCVTVSVMLLSLCSTFARCVNESVLLQSLRSTFARCVTVSVMLLSLSSSNARMRALLAKSSWMVRW